MQVPEPSRRQILTGLVGGLFAWLWSGKTPSAAPPPTPVAIGPVLPDAFCSVATYTYCTDGTFTALANGRPNAAKSPLMFGDNLAQVTTYTYDAVG